LAYVTIDDSGEKKEGVSASSSSAGLKHDSRENNNKCGRPVGKPSPNLNTSASFDKKLVLNVSRVSALKINSFALR